MTAGRGEVNLTDRGEVNLTDRREGTVEDDHWELGVF